MRRDPVTLVWLAGLVVLVLVIRFGPGLFAVDLPAAVSGLITTLDRDLRDLGQPARAAIRAGAIAAWLVFIALCVLARRRRLPSMGIAIVVTLLFVAMVGAPGEWSGPVPGAHWTLALLVALSAALLMTRRLRP